MTMALPYLIATGKLEHFVHFSLCLPLCRATPNSVVSYRMDQVMHDDMLP